MWLEVKGRTYTTPFFRSSLSVLTKLNSLIQGERMQERQCSICCPWRVWSHSLCPPHSGTVPSHYFLVRVHNGMQNQKEQDFLLPLSASSLFIWVVSSVIRRSAAHVPLCILKVKLRRVLGKKHWLISVFCEQSLLRGTVFCHFLDRCVVCMHN